MTTKTICSTKETGYPVPTYQKSVKRYCQTLDLKEDAALIAEYERRHQEANAWPEIRAGIRKVGILEMEIYRMDHHLFMIVETPLDFEWDTAFAQLDMLPRQKEWEAYMSLFQQTEPGSSSAKKWKLMERIFHLYK